MRNWNLVNGNDCCWDETGFYFTYEELKLIRPVYFAPYVTGFYFTYEELKPVKVPLMLPLFKVFTLPMRNWNIMAGRRNF